MTNGQPPSGPPQPPGQPPYPPQPPGQPAYPQQPGQPPYGQYGQYGQPAAGIRPGSVTAGGVMAIVLGSLRVLFGIIGLIVLVSVLEEFDDEGLVLAIGGGVIALVILLGVLQIIGGAAVLRSRGRALALVATIITLALGVLGLIGSLGGGAAEPANLIGALVFVIADIIAIVLLSKAPLGPILALAGVGLILVTWPLPLVAEFRLLAPEGVSFTFWFWQFLETAVMLGAVAGAAALALTTRGGRLHAGILVGFGAAAVAFFLEFLAIAFSEGFPFGAGAAVGVVAGGLILAGGLVAARRGDPAEGTARPIGPTIALVGVVLLLLAGLGLFLGVGSARTGIGVDEQLVVLAAIAVGAVGAAWALASRARRLPGGLMVGGGIPGAMYFFSTLAIETTIQRFSPSVLVGLVGGALLIIGGAICASQGPSERRAAPPPSFA